MATVDAAHCLVWCTPALAALFLPPAMAGQSIASLLGTAAAERLTAGEAHACDLVDGAGQASPWRWQLQGCDPLRVLSAELWAGQRALQAAHDRLAPVQSLTCTGNFERDPLTLIGEWDAQMYRIWGLPAPSSTSESPNYRATAMMILNVDRDPKVFVNSLTQPGLHALRVRIRRPDGEWRYLRSQWRVTPAGEGRPGRVLGINTDDTEVCILALRAERLRTELDVALELGHIAVWRRDLVSGRVMLDRRGCALIGVPCSEQGVTLAEARERSHPDDRPLAAASVELSLRTGEPSDMQLRYPKPGGDWRHVLLRRALLRGANGHALAFVGAMLDVAERAAASRHVQELERRLQAAAEAARIGLWSTPSGKLLQSRTQRRYTLFGLDPDAGPLPLEVWMLRCAHPEGLPCVRETSFKGWRSTGGGLDIEFCIIGPGDSVQPWLVARGEQRREPPEGGARIAEGVTIDISEQQQDPHQLRETLDRMTLANQALGLGTWENDKLPGVAQWDAQMFHLRGVTSPERTNQCEEFALMLHPEVRAMVKTLQVDRIRDGLPWHSEFRVLWPDGQWRWLSSQSVPVHDEQGCEQRRFGLNWDNTDVRAAIESTRQIERAPAESRAKSQTLSRISHELRTPLNAVLGFVKLLRGDTRQQVDEPQRQRWLAHIDDAGRHLLSLIDDVLELSRVEAGEQPRAPQAVALAPLIEATLQLLAGALEAAQVDVHCGAITGWVPRPARWQAVASVWPSSGCWSSRWAAKSACAARPRSAASSPWH